ncbi:NACHT domain- and WD repeat-containing protein 1-like [Mya arenaria]|uniref:NACHT domain- and WD repeat-containing protein 1-like n=1 Tax=Mya arenaria TaxID=6604 RepID=UPI0022DF1331|nr:NACHT domain- and WD repeat-containing protein 1-like [Mya arenaria]
MFKAFKSDDSEEELPWLQALDAVEGMELWDSRSREEREPWKYYLKQADDILAKPRSSIPEDVVSAVLSGDLGTLDLSSIPSAQPRVVVFVSSTFTDTKAERNQLMKDVYPFLRTLCRRLGVEFGTVDMRWGVTDEATSDHSTVNMCVSEIHRCVKDSIGPAFLCLLGHKYGYRPLPAAIDQSEFDTMKEQMEKAGKDTRLLAEYYKLDRNAVPAEYVLKNQEPSNKSWWPDVEAMQKALREASVSCFGAKSPVCDKYHVSVTETEIQNGAFLNERHAEQTSFIRRDLKNYNSDFHLNRKITDLVDGKVDPYAAKMLDMLRQQKIPSQTSKAPMFSIQYDSAKVKQASECTRIVCDQVCKTLADGILDSYEKRLHIKADRVFQEVVQHRAHAQEKSSMFVGREIEIARIMEYVRSSSNLPLVVHGPSGCGKTALMAVTAKKVKDAISHGVLVLRFLGTTGQSASARLLLYNICQQITRVYGQNADNIPTAYKELIVYFRTCCAYATSDKPLVIILDSLDQLSNEDFGQNLSWLSLSEVLPENVKMIVSSLPVRTLDILKTNLQNAECFLEVKPLALHEGPEVMKLMLGAKKRTVTEDQLKLIMTAFKKCPLPLFLRLVVDLALQWRSFDTIDSTVIADDMVGLIDRLFDRLEGRYGRLFVCHALAYITAAKSGLSFVELEDILSCDDDVLDAIFKWWVPPFRRLPPLLWARVRNELGSYLAERGTDGVSAYGWYHRQFWETAERRYLQTGFGDDPKPFAQKAHLAIADYFEGKWANGKPYKGKDGVEKVEDRKIPKQPFVVGGSRDVGRQLNERKLAELPYHLIKLQDWERFKKLALDLRYIEAKFEADDGYICLSELIEATKLSKSDEIKQMTRFVGASLGFLARESVGVYQMASQQASGSLIRRLLVDVGTDEQPRTLLRSLEEVSFEDPCEMTLHGHTGSVRCCDFSPAGDLIVSSSDDCTMRIWDTTTGAEIVTVTSLPAPIFPDPEENPQQLMLHAVNPCCFSRNGDVIASGTELGDVMLWDKSGVQLNHVKTDKRAVSFIQFSPDNRHIATAFKYGHLSIWNARDLSHVVTRDLDWFEVTGLDYSRDGSKLAVVLTNGLMTFNTKDYSELSKVQGTCQNLCCQFYPDGTQIMTGGDNSAVTIWDANNGTISSRLKGIKNQHTAWIWSIKFDTTGKHMFTCSSDRSMKIWRLADEGVWSVLKTVAGHSHRFCMSSIEPGLESKLVTCSLDTSLRVWDMKTLLEGATPPVGKGHYLVCEWSGRYLATAQGWMHQCNVVDGDNILGSTEKHVGFVRQARFLPDQSGLLVLDHGHSGDYRHGAEKDACVRLVSIPDLGTVGLAEVDAPTSITCTDKYIIVGTLDGEVAVFEHDLKPVCKRKLPKGKPITRLAAHGSCVAAATDSPPECVLLTVKKNKLVETQTDGHPVVHVTSSCNALEFSKDGTYFVYGSSAHDVIIWEISAKGATLMNTLTSHHSYIMDVKFSPTGRYMLSSSATDLRVWDVHEGFRMVCVYYAPVNCAAFVEDHVILGGEATGNLLQLKF